MNCNTGTECLYRASIRTGNGHIWLPYNYWKKGFYVLKWVYSDTDDNLK